MAKIKLSDTTSRVLKTLGIFGSVEVITILCSVVRTKFAALWLGPVGVGINTIYNSTMTLLANTSQLNIQNSGVRDISCSHNQQQALVVAAVRKVSLLLALAASIGIIILSPAVSLWAFGDIAHWTDFILLSVWFPLSAIAATEMCIMRGTGRFRSMARTSLFTALVTVAAAVPLFYYLRLRGIIPVFLCSYGANCFFAMLFRNRDIENVTITLRQAWQVAKPMVSLGIYMTVSGFVTMLASNIFIIYLNHNHGEISVGLYQAGYTLVNTYVGMIFTAISTEYYPRLSTMVKSRMRTEIVVSHEIKIALMVLMPVVALFVFLSPVIMNILYSSEFSAALPFVAIGAVGVFFRAISWCLAFTILARGDGRIYIVSETLSAILYLIIFIPFYNILGFIGLGVAYILWYALYTLIVWTIYRFRYGLRLRKGIVPLICLSLAVGLAALLAFKAFVI